MTLLFTVGVMNLAWIAALSVFVLTEKIIPRGFWLAKAGGLLLMVWGGWLAAVNPVWTPLIVISDTVPPVVTIVFGVWRTV
jgi:ABC-type nitrate/sulfonate/bicarbonate transport system permease component